MIIIPTIEAQIKDLVANFPAYVDKITGSFNSIMSNSIFESYYNEAQAWIEANLGDIPSAIMAYFGDAMSSIASFANTLTTIIVSLVLFPFVLFFLLKDGREFREYSLTLFPKKFRKDISQILYN